MSCGIIETVKFSDKCFKSMLSSQGLNKFIWLLISGTIFNFISF